MASTWLQNAAGGAVNVGASMGASTLNVPAGKRLVRFVINPVMSGVQAPGSGGGPTILGPVYYLQTITINSTEYANRVIWEAYRLLKFSGAALWDGLVGLPANRVYTIWHGGGWDELGVNEQCSYGGPGHGAIAVKLTHGVFSARSGEFVFSVSFSYSFKVLYV